MNNNIFVQWEKLRNKHDGEACVIVGNGPSLNDTPTELINSLPNFCANRVKPDINVKYYSAVNPSVITQFMQEIDDIKAEQKFIRKTYSEFFKNTLPLESVPLRVFSSEPGTFIYEGYTVTYVSMQLAYFMGFKKIFLVGVDHRYKFEGQPNELRRLEGIDENHWDPAYFSNKDWNNPDLKESELSYTLAYRIFKSNGVQCLNCTPGSALDIFETGTFDDIKKAIEHED